MEIENDARRLLQKLRSKGYLVEEGEQTVLHVRPQLRNGWFPLANEWAEVLASSGLNGSEFRLLFWWFRNAYGRERKIAASWPGAKKVGEEIGMHPDQVKRTLAGMCRAGMFKRKGDEITVVKNWLTWDIWKWVLERDKPVDNYPQGTNQSPVSGDESVPKKGTNQSPYINKEVLKIKDKDLKTPERTALGAEIGLLITEFQMMLEKKLGEKPMVNRGAAAKGFKRLLATHPRHEIQSRFNHWFDSTEPFLVKRSWRVEDFIIYFPGLKNGPIKSSNRRDEPEEERQKRIREEMKKNAERTERANRIISGK